MIKSQDIKILKYMLSLFGKDKKNQSIHQFKSPNLTDSTPVFLTKSSCLEVVSKQGSYQNAPRNIE